MNKLKMFGERMRGFSNGLFFVLWIDKCSANNLYSIPVFFLGLVIAIYFFIYGTSRFEDKQYRRII